MGVFNLKKNGKPDDLFYLEVRPILFLFRVFARLPFSITEEGRLKAFPLSLCTFIWFIIYGIQSYAAVDLSGRILYLLKSEKSFVMTIIMMLNLLFILLHFQLPLALISEAKQICNYINKWAEFQEEFNTVIGMKFIPKNKKRVILMIISSPFQILGIMYMEQQITFFNKFYQAILYFSVFWVCYLNVIFWVTCLWEMSHAAFYIKERIKEISKLQNSNTPRLIHDLRQLWISLAKLLDQFGCSIGFTMIIIIGINHICFIASSYAVLSTLISGGSDFIIFASILLFSIISTYCIIEPANRTTQMIKNEIYNQLMDMEILNMDDMGLKELDRFLHAVKGMDPHMSLGGFYTVDRHLITALLSSAVTYLVVLIQFSAHSEQK